MQVAALTSRASHTSRVRQTVFLFARLHARWHDWPINSTNVHTYIHTPTRVFILYSKHVYYCWGKVKVMMVGDSGGRVHDSPSTQRTPLQQQQPQPQPQPQGSPSNANLERRRTNPLGELIATETRYVQELSIAIRRIAAAWSPNKLPHKELDLMFRSLEVLYRTNSEFLRSLQEIGPNPASPKGLGNLLMHWVDNLQAPYANYLAVYMPLLDTSPSILSNKDLHHVLAQVSRELPRSAGPDSAWTLDAFFALPIERLRFYKKLYGRLLRNTQPGRSDHTMLQSANQTLNELIDTAVQRQSISRPGAVLTPLALPRSTEPVERVLSPPVSHPASSRAQGSPPSAPIAQPALTATTTTATPSVVTARGEAPGELTGPVAKSTAMEPNTSSGSLPVLGQALVPPNDTLAPTATASKYPPSITSSLESQSLEEIQSRIDSTCTIDIFSMEPKSCRLQMAPPGLTFQRKLRLTDGLRLEIVPANGPVRIIERARLILLTDLILVAEDRASQTLPSGTQDIRLIFPPLSGRFVDTHDDKRPQDPSIRLSIMNRVNLIMHLGRIDRKAIWLHELRACKLFGADKSASEAPRLPSNAPVPPMTNALVRPSAGTPNVPAPPFASPSPLTNEVGGGRPPPFAPNQLGIYSRPPAPLAGPLSTPVGTGKGLSSGTTVPGSGAARPMSPVSSPAPLAPPALGPIPSSTPAPGTSHAIMSPSGAASIRTNAPRPGGMNPAATTSGPNAPFASGAPAPPIMPGTSKTRTPGGEPNHALSPNKGSVLLDSVTESPTPSGLSKRLGPEPNLALSSPSASSFLPGIAGPGASQSHGGKRLHPGGPPPPLIFPQTSTTDAQSPVPLADEDSGLSSPPLTPEPPTRANSLASHESFPRIGRRVDSPEPLVPQRLEDTRPGVRPPMVQGPAMSFGSASEHALGGFQRTDTSLFSADRRPSNAPTPSLRGMRSMTLPTTVSNASAPSVSSPSGPSPSVSQSRLREAAGSAVLPSQMLREKPQRRSSEWIHQHDEEDKAADADALQFSKFHEAQSFNICAQMRCKVYLKQSYAQWRALGSARLRLYRLRPSNSNQLVVENEKKVMISSIVLPMAVQRFGKTGLAIELSDMGRLTGVVYMFHMRSEESANGLYEQLLSGSSRSALSSPQST